MEDFIRTHRDTCARVGERLAPETDEDIALRNNILLYLPVTNFLFVCDNRYFINTPRVSFMVYNP